MKHIFEFLICAAVVWFACHAVTWLMIRAYEHDRPTCPTSDADRAAVASYSNRWNWWISLGGLAGYTILRLFW